MGAIAVGGGIQIDACCNKEVVLCLSVCTQDNS